LHEEGDLSAEVTSSSRADVDQRSRRREITATVVDTTLACVLLLTVYYLIPFTDLTSGQSLLRLGLGVVIFVMVLVWQLRRVTRAQHPVLRAVHALAVTIPLFLVAFAAVYLSLSLGTETHFSEGLDHTGALYLAITIFSTVGFGDITPESELARIVVSIQMLLDLVVIGVVVRLLSTAAKTGKRNQSAGDTDGADA
jgi:voltage-gated potassium channel